MVNSYQKKSTNKEIRERFDNDVERFSDLNTGQISIADASLQMELITNSAALICPNAINILDIGCGAGNNTLKLLERINPLNCDLIDLSYPMLERAKERVSTVSKGQIEIFQEDIRTVNLPKEKYDIIIGAAVFHHLRDDRDWETTFQKIYNLTAPGGCLMITDFVTHENSSIQNLMHEMHGNYLESIGGTEYRQKVLDYIEEEDSPRPVTYQLDVLRKAGYSHVDILHKNITFSAFCSVKSL